MVRGGLYGLVTVRATSVVVFKRVNEVYIEDTAVWMFY
jgi:hypothetical protein